MKFQNQLRWHKLERTGSTSRGMIIVDVVVAIGLVALFIYIINTAVSNLELDFLRLRTLKLALQQIEIGSSSPERIRNYGRWFEQFRIPVGEGQIYTVSERYDGEKNAQITPMQYSFCSPDLTNAFAMGEKSSLHIGSSNIKFLLTPVRLPIPSEWILTQIELRGNILIASVDSAFLNDPDILVFNMSDRSNPTLISATESGPGIAGFVILGRYIYAAARSTAYQIHVFRINMLDDVILISKNKLHRNNASTSLPYASEIWTDGTHLFVGTEKWVESELQIFDMLENGEIIYSGEFDSGSKVNAIRGDSNLLYVADSDTNQFYSLDVSDSSAPRPLANFLLSGTSRQEGNVIDSMLNQVVLGRTSGGFDIDSSHELHFFSNNTLVSSLNVSGGVYGVHIDSDGTYLISGTNGGEISLIQNENGLIHSYTLPVWPEYMSCFVDEIVVLARNSPTIYMIKVNANL